MFMIQTSEISDNAGVMDTSAKIATFGDWQGPLLSLWYAVLAPRISTGSV